ncbi:MAG: 7-carboxy-7-deazaguanine synthase QueE [Polyangiaceae bacterium]|nr:7-carboxy-7-deazaguanine synthase QueE [Polyangiaceae bacterium]MCB9606550.1 7-carboxy-7-deazaguanine synthase QueE [Polyangiaceae bacterium]
MDPERALPPNILRISEVFASIQGEGASTGAPCVFLRLALCNLRCSWCDTKYTWDWKQFRYADEVKERSVDDLAEEVSHLLADLDLKGERNAAKPPSYPNNAPHLPRLVITGGEPLIQSKALIALLAQLPDDVVVEVETNGTFAPTLELAERVNQWNVSPKLAHGGDPEKRRIVDDALLALGDTGRAWLKLVVEGEQDWREIEALVERLEWPRERVMLMPQATDPESLKRRLPLVESIAARQHVRACTRLHVELWGGRRGV